MTQAELEALCAKWQRILRLQDWDVVPKLVRWHEMPTDRLGECDHRLSKKMAVIRVLDPNDAPPNNAWPHDPEKTLVHELLHLHFAPFRAEPDTPADVAQEQVIDTLARALVALARGKMPDVHPAAEAAAELPGAAVAGASEGKVVSLEEWRRQRASNPKVRRTA